MCELSIGVFLSKRPKGEDSTVFFSRLKAYSSTNTIVMQKPIAPIDRGPYAPGSESRSESGIGSIYAEICTSACFWTETSGYGPRNQFHN